ncbi:MAG: SAM hydrolase/SAM-dependent halogenase family protein [Candidatus Thorarchaeota archaeon]|jgi:S-adenosylmethionine hydrolase
MIVLMTDFGESEYVGIMKGVIHSIAPAVKVVDLTHSITPQSIREGAWVLFNSYHFFPEGSIFVCVVDPGVGTDRDAVVVKTENYTFVGPDNGLMYPAAKQDSIVEISSIIIDESASATFHGRDVFAKTAAQLFLGEGQKLLGGFKPTLSASLEFYLDGNSGEIVRIDHFGNIITNIPYNDVTKLQLESKYLKWNLIWSPTYDQGPDDQLFAITSSYGTFEIAMKNGRAIDELTMKVGDRISLIPQ